MRNAHRHTIVVLSLALAFSVPTSTAATSPERAAETIAPFVDAQTVFVAHADLSALDFTALARRAAGGDPPYALASAASAAQGIVEQLRQAGADDAFVVVSTAYIPREPWLVVVPLAAGANTDLLQELLGDLLPGRVAVQAEAVVAGPAELLGRLADIPPDDRAELGEAFTAAGESTVQLVLLPTDDNRRVVEETMPVLPGELGGGPSTVLTRGVLWLAAGATLEPQASIRAVAQSASPEAAAALAEWCEGIPQVIAGLPEVGAELPQLGEALELLTVASEGSRVTVHLGPDEFRQAVAILAGPLLEAAREDAERSRRTAAAHNVLLGCMMYAADHDGAWPGELSDLVDGGFVDGPEDIAGLTYLRPPADAPAGRVVLHGSKEVWPRVGLVVGYYDGFVTVVKDEAEFRRQLEQGR